MLLFKQTRQTFHYTILHNNNINTGFWSNIMGKNKHLKNEKEKSNTWIPHSSDCIKWNTDFSRLEVKKSTKSIRYAETLDVRIISYGHCWLPVLIVKTLALGEAFRIANQVQLFNVIVGSKLEITIYPIMLKYKALMSSWKRLTYCGLFHAKTQGVKSNFNSSNW